MLRFRNLKVKVAGLEGLGFSFEDLEIRVKGWRIVSIALMPFGLTIRFTWWNHTAEGLLRLRGRGFGSEG